MDDETLDAIAQAVVRALREQDTGGLTPQQHREHHDALARFIAREDRRAELFERMKASAGGWIVITAIGGVGYVVWDFLRSHLR